MIAVLTAEDLPVANDVSPSIHDEPLLADGEVYYLGQPIFAVVATAIWPRERRRGWARSRSPKPRAF